MALISRIPQIIAKAEGIAGVAVRKTMADIEAGAKGAAPVDTGNLRSSIQSRSTGVTSGIVEANADYATYVEFGTTRSPAQPYFTPAVEAARPALNAALRQVAGG